MGVSGCGKSSIGKLVSKNLGIPFFDGDSFHSESNIAKMANGNPLNDEDRKPWDERAALDKQRYEKEMETYIPPPGMSGPKSRKKVTTPNM